MAQQFFLGALSRFVVSAVVAGLAVLASSVACQSGSDDGDGTRDGDPIDGAVAASAAPTSVPPRDDRPSPTANDGAPSGGAAAAPAGAGSPADAADPSSQGPSAAGSAADASGSEAMGAGQAFQACATTEGSYGGNCDIIYVTVKQTAPSRCVQLTIDNCGGYNSQGLPVDAPTSWRLASGSIGSDPSDCDLGVFDPEKAGVIDASGTITWNELTPAPSELALDLTLEPSSSARDSASVRVTTSEPLDPIDCEP